MDKVKIIQSIKKTGFPLEHKISIILKEHGWKTINNRYYIDEAKQIEREIDILAYKCRLDTENKIAFYTTLIISCKKSKSSIWTFMTMDHSSKDPNFKDLIIDNMTSDKRLELMLKNYNEEIEEKISSDSKVECLFKVNKRVFGFQQINKESYKTEDDKRIYDSIITTIKSLEYESGKKTHGTVVDGCKTSFYNFNLISIFDGEMIDIHFDKNSNVEKIEEIKIITYINRHIIKRNEKFYKILFCNSDEFDIFLKHYDDLDELNYKTYQKLIDKYYLNIFEDEDKVKIYWNDFCNEIQADFKFVLLFEYNKVIKEDKCTFNYEYNDNCLKIYCNEQIEYSNEDLFKKINLNEGINSSVRKKLFKYFRYEGEFKFIKEPLPF